MTGKEESDLEPSYRIACSISPEKNRSHIESIVLMLFIEFY
jgi:hypothetical protein